MTGAGFGPGYRAATLTTGEVCPDDKRANYYYRSTHESMKGRGSQIGLVDQWHPTVSTHPKKWVEKGGNFIFSGQMPAGID